MDPWLILSHGAAFLAGVMCVILRLLNGRPLAWQPRAGRRLSALWPSSGGADADRSLAARSRMTPNRSAATTLVSTTNESKLKI